MGRAAHVGDRMTPDVFPNFAMKVMSLGQAFGLADAGLLSTTLAILLLSAGRSCATAPQSEASQRRRWSIHALGAESAQNRVLVAG